MPCTIALRVSIASWSRSNCSLSRSPSEYTARIRKDGALSLRKTAQTSVPPFLRSRGNRRPGYSAGSGDPRRAPFSSGCPVSSCSLARNGLPLSCFRPTGDDGGSPSGPVSGSSSNVVTSPGHWLDSPSVIWKWTNAQYTGLARAQAPCVAPRPPSHSFKWRCDSACTLSAPNGVPTKQQESSFFCGKTALKKPDTIQLLSDGINCPCETVWPLSVATAIVDGIRWGFDSG